ncbi:MAG: Crp/Fnr family transcriptional regulator [Gammaproteobacteria bacterium]|nr:Crp/Fnr family transcriptional regulator [Gammaproteobacteria bacterium]
MPNDLITSEQLRRIHLLGALSETQLEAVHAGARLLTLKPGAELFARGDRATRFFFVVSGQIVLKRLSPDGDEKIIEIVRPGQTFAEAIMFMGAQTYPVTAVALDPCTLIALDSDTFKELLSQSVDTCMRLLADLSVRLRRWITEVESLTLQNATWRVVSFLLQQVPEGAASPVCIDLRAPKHIIASRLSVTPETFSRILRQLADSGRISVDGMSVMIFDQHALARAGTE